jgi:Mrp family chromosome partitioning ATPase
MSSLDQAFIKAFKQQGLALNTAALEAAPSAPGIKVEAEEVHGAGESSSAVGKLDDLMSVLEKQSDPTAQAQSAAEAAPSAVEKQLPAEKEKDSPASDSSPVKRKAKSKSGQKGKRKTAQAPQLEEMDLPEVVYRLDPPSSAMPILPRTALFTSSSTGDIVSPGGGLNLSSEEKGALPLNSSMTQINSAHLSSADGLESGGSNAAAGSFGDQESLAVNGNHPQTPVLHPSMTHSAGAQATQTREMPTTCFSSQAIIRVFQPMLQVDHFAWPKICRRLETAAALELDRLTESLLKIRQQGKKVMAIGGAQRGSGATTLLLCAAKRLAARNVKTVIIDADLSEPQLAKRLGILPQLGWEDIAAGRQPVEEVLVESSVDNLAILPLCGPLVISEISYASQRQMAESLYTLRTHYDLVFMDLGPLEKPQSLGDLTSGGLNCRIDAVILVHNVGKTPNTGLSAVRQSLAAAGVTLAGVIENFIPSKT